MDRFSVYYVILIIVKITDMYMFSFRCFLSIHFLFKRYFIMLLIFVVLLMSLHCGVGIRLIFEFHASTPDFDDTGDLTTL